MATASDHPPDPRLARQGYTAEEVDRFLRMSGLAESARFDLLDITPTTVSETLAMVQTGTFPKVGELETVVREHGAATVKVSGEQRISGTCKIDMEPDDRLRDTELEWAVQPQYLLRVPNGDILEFPQGVYVYGGADRNLDPTLENWSLQMGDLTWFLDMAGILFGGFAIPEGIRYTDGLKVLLALSKIFDFSGIHDSEVTAPAEAIWGMDRAPDLGWTGFWYFKNEGSGGGQAQVRTTTMLDVYGDVMDALSYYPPWTNRQGVIQAKPVRDIRSADPAATFGTARDSITSRDITTASDLARITNFVYCFTENPQGTDTFIGIADADHYFPDHPWAQNRKGRYLPKTVNSVWATSVEAANAEAFKALCAGLTYNQTIQYETGAYPTLEPYDVNLLYVEGDHEVGTPTPYMKVGYDFDLFAGRMTHTDRRIVLPRNDLGVIDVGLTDPWNIATVLPT